MLILLALPTSAAASISGCPRMYTASEVIEAADTAEGYFQRVDPPGFELSRQAMEQRVACAQEVLTAEAAGRVHRVEAIAAFLDARPERVTEALAGLFAALPGAPIPTEVLPEGHPIRRQVAAATAEIASDVGVDVPVPATGWVVVDGGRAQRVPGGRPAVIQQVDAGGGVVANHYRWPDEVGFSWLVEAPALAARKPAPQRVPLLAACAASLVASGTMLALSEVAHGEFNGAALKPDATAAEQADYRARLEQIQSRTNTLTWAFYGTAGLGVALGAVAAVTW